MPLCLKIVNYKVISKNKKQPFADSLLVAECLNSVVLLSLENSSFILALISFFLQ